MITIPQSTKEFTQTNRSDLLGVLSGTFNMDFQGNLGVARVSPRLKINTNGLDGCPVAFRYFDTKIWTIAGTRIYANGGLPSSLTFTEDVSTGVQTDYSSDESDMEIFASNLLTTTTDALYSKVLNGSGTGAWTSRDTLNTGSYHGMTYFKKFDRLYYTDQQDNILSINSALDTPADPGSPYAISLSADSNSYTITCFRAASSRIWIGIIDKSNEMGQGKILEWDGQSAQIFNEYKIQAQGCLSMVIDQEQDIPYVMDSNGSLLKFTGIGFTEVGRLPTMGKLLDLANGSTTNRFIHPKGLRFTKQRTVHALVNNKNADGTYNDNFPAGIYEFDLKGGCVHVGSVSRTTTTEISDYGQERLARVGALESANIYSSSASRNGTFLMGATYFTDVTNTSSAVFYDDSNDTLQKYGYIVSNWIESQQVKDVWQNIFAYHKRYLDSADKIIIKYRTTESPSTELNIVWDSSTTVFRTQTDLTGKEGYEIEVLQGQGSGKTAHIVSISNQGSWYFITLDDSFTGTTTGSGKARMQDWIKCGEITDLTDEEGELPLGPVSFRIQIKCCLQFKGKDELRRLAIINEVAQKT